MTSPSGDDGVSEGEATWAEPMLAQLVRPEEHGRSAGRWQYEQKFDGLRCLAVRNGPRVELWSRNRLSYTARFPSIVAALGGLPADRFTLDGELVSFDPERGRFGGFLQRGGGVPVYCVFDIVALLGRDTRGLVLTERQDLVRRVLDGAAPPLLVVPALDGNAAGLLRRAYAEGWEGIVAKRLDSTYHGGRSPAWQKLKCTASQELVVGGWTDPTGSRHGFGALLVGYYDGAGAFHYAGKVGTGFNEPTLREISARLAELAVPASPFAGPVPDRRGVHWVAPALIAEVSFAEWTPDGRLRHPSFRSLRDDKDPRSVVREEAPGA